MSFYSALIKPLVFRLDPERAHYFTMGLFNLGLHLPFGRHIIRKQFTLNDPKLKRTVFGLEFPNPVGLAAGFDKDAKFIGKVQELGFGFIEIGTVTPRPQPGNPRPRLFRLPASLALINRMGFNNEGVEMAASRLAKLKRRKVLVGGNIGKNKDTDNADAADDYLRCFEVLYPHVDYFAVNVSSPNTPNLRALQDKEPLTQLLAAIQEKNNSMPSPKPVLLKIAPDLEEAGLDDIIGIVRETGISGIIATNTTISRNNLKEPVESIEKIGAGGLSGEPVRNRSTEVIRYLHTASGGDIPIIGVGGICTPKDAIEKLEAGASLVQIYTGMIYSGPGLVRSILQALSKEMG